MISHSPVTELFVIAVLLVAAWTVWMILRTLAAEIGHREAIHDLRIRVAEIRRSQQEKLRRLHEHRIGRTKSRATATPPTEPLRHPAAINAESDDAGEAANGEAHRQAA